MGKTTYFVDNFDPLLLSDVSCVASLRREEGTEIVFVLSSDPVSVSRGASLEERKAMLGAFFHSLDESSPLRLYPFEKSEGKTLKGLLEYLSAESGGPLSFLSREEGLPILRNALDELPLGLRERISLASLPKKPISGTISTKENPLTPFDVPASIWGEIEERRLYYIDKLSRLLQSEHRLNHSISVARLSYRIALCNELKEPEKAYVAGLFHDAGKHYSKEDNEKIMETKFPAYLAFPEWTFHQFVGEYLAEKEFGIEDEAVVKAIRCHATGEKKMGPLSKIVYSADKIEPLRGYDSSGMIRLCLSDYRKGFLKVLSENRAYLTGKGYKVDNPLTKECFDYYLGEEYEGK